jgi:hypothetical protein
LHLNLCPINFLGVGFFVTGNPFFKIFTAHLLSRNFPDMENVQWVRLHVKNNGPPREPSRRCPHLVVMAMAIAIPPLNSELLTRPSSSTIRLQDKYGPPKRFFFREFDENFTNLFHYQFSSTNRLQINISKPKLQGASACGSTRVLTRLPATGRSKHSTITRDSNKNWVCLRVSTVTPRLGNKKGDLLGR